MSNVDAVRLWLDHTKTAMRAEGIPGDTVDRVLNRLKFGAPDGDRDARMTPQSVPFLIGASDTGLPTVKAVLDRLPEGTVVTAALAEQLPGEIP